MRKGVKIQVVKITTLCRFDLRLSHYKNYKTTLIQKNMIELKISDLYHDAHQVLSTNLRVAGNLNSDHLHPIVEQLLTKWMRITLRENRINLQHITEKDFDDLKHNILSTIQKAYLELLNSNENTSLQQDEVESPPETRKTNLENGTLGMQTEIPSTQNEKHSTSGGLVSLSEEEINAISQQFETQFKRAFWDKITEDLKETPPKTDHIIVLLGEILERLDKLTPNNQKIIYENHENIDLSLFKNLFESSQFHLEALQGVVVFLVEDRLQKFIAPAYDEDLKLWYLNLKNEMSKGLPYYEIVPLIFQGIYQWLENVEKSLEEFNKVRNRLRK